MRRFLSQLSDGQVLVWPKISSIELVAVIDVQEGGLYRLLGHQGPC